MVSSDPAVVTDPDPSMVSSDPAVVPDPDPSMISSDPAVVTDPDTSMISSDPAVVTDPDTSMISSDPAVVTDPDPSIVSLASDPAQSYEFEGRNSENTLDDDLLCGTSDSSEDEHEYDVSSRFAVKRRKEEKELVKAVCTVSSDPSIHVFMRKLNLHVEAFPCARAVEHPTQHTN